MKKIYESYGCDFEFLGLKSIQINIEPTKASIGSYTDLTPNLKNSISILNIRNSKYNCLQLCITAFLYPAMNYATREIKYENNLIVPRQQDEDDFAYILRKQKLYNINIWIYIPRGYGKVESFKSVDDFVWDRKDVRILVWENAGVEPCALIKTIENLLDPPNKMHHNFCYCSSCTYCFNTQIE